MRIGKVMTCLMDYGHGHRESHRAFWAGSLHVGSRLTGKVLPDMLAFSFGSGNVFFGGAMNAQEFDGMDLTHIASMHNDIWPEPGWLDILMDEMEATGADFLSVVLPIKDMNGLSSTAIDSTDDPFCVERRLTMAEVMDLPETFSAADCGYPDRALLVNTGLWLMDWTKDWRKLENPDGTLAINCTSPDRLKRRPPDPKKAVDAKVIVDGAEGTVIEVVGNDARVAFGDGSDVRTLPIQSLDLKGPYKEAKLGRWEAQHSPADWYLSRHLHNIGAKVLATRKLHAVHLGDMPYSNKNVWGWETDNALKHKFGGVPIKDRIKKQSNISNTPIGAQDATATEAAVASVLDTPTSAFQSAGTTAD